MSGIVRLVMLVMLLSPWLSAYGAQSTKDVTASEKLKSEALASVLGGAPSAEIQQQEYVIGNGDILTIEVYGEGSMAIASPGVGQGGKVAVVYVAQRAEFRLESMAEYLSGISGRSMPSVLH